MVTRKWWIVLDLFAWSWTTLVAAKKNWYNYIGIELTEEYIPIIEARLNNTQEKVIEKMSKKKHLYSNKIKIMVRIYHKYHNQKSIPRYDYWGMTGMD